MKNMLKITKYKWDTGDKRELKFRSSALYESWKYKYDGTKSAKDLYDFLRGSVCADIWQKLIKLMADEMK